MKHAMETAFGFFQPIYLEALYQLTMKDFGLLWSCKTHRLCE